MIRKSIFLFFILAPFLIFSQDYRYKFRRIGIPDGLSQNSANAITQDKQGFIWVATQDGLNKYDGYKFTVYRHNREDSLSLRDNYINALLTDEPGNLWIGTEYGVDLRHPHSEVFEHISVTADGYSGVKDPSIYSLAVDQEQNIWMGSTKGLFRYSTVTKKFDYFKKGLSDLSEYPSDDADKIFVDRSGVVWIGNHAGLTKYDPKTKKFETYSNNPKDKSSIIKGSVYAIAEDYEGYLWAGTYYGLSKFDPSKKKFTQYTHSEQNKSSISSNYIYTILEDKNKTLWIGTVGGGLNQYIRKTDSFTKHTNYQGNLNSISQDEIFSLFEDKTQVLWVGTNGGGLSVLDTKPQKFLHIYGERGNNESISSNDIWALFMDTKNNLWIGTNDGGLNKIDESTGKVTVFKEKYENPHSVSSAGCYAIAEDRWGRIWIGTDNALNQYNPKTGTIKKYSVKAYELGSGQRYFYIDQHDQLWIASSHGLVRFDLKTEEIKNFRNNPDDPETLTSGRGTTIFEDKSGRLWVGTTTGLNLMDKEKNTFKRYTHDPKNNNSLCYPSIQSIIEDNDENLWIGTGLGLCVIEKTTEKFISFYEQDGLPNACIYNLLKDDDGFFWASTNNGITRFNPLELIKSPKEDRQKLFKNFTQQDGLQSNEFNHGAAFRSEKGELFFGGINGFNRFYPSELKYNIYVPQIAITNFKILDQPVNMYKSLINPSNEITLSYLQNVFSFEFAALDFTNPANNQYAYMLDGFDHNWIVSGNRRYISYTNLDAGEYTFRVKGSNNDGTWNNEGESVRIIIIPPWWKTKIAYALYFFFAIWLIYTLMKWRANSLENEKRLLERVVLEKTAELKSSYEQLRHSQEQLVHTEKMRVIGQLASGIAHDINNILSIILGSSEILQTKIKDAESGKRVKTISKAATDGASIIKRLQEFSKNEQTEINQTIHLNEILTEVLDMTTYLVSEKKEKENIVVRYEHFFGEIPPISGNASELRSVITNILINAVDSFNRSGKITISTCWNQSDFVEIKIQDEGKGIPKDILDRVFEPFFTTKGTRGSGLGLSQVYGIISRHQGHISVESEVGFGTTFTILIPVKLSMEGEMVHHENMDKNDSVYISNLGKKLLLVVEDEEAIQGIYKDVIEEMGMLPVFASSGEEGIEKWNSGKYDLIISDIGLPGISGWDFIKNVREQDDKIPILVITGWGNEITNSTITSHKVNKIMTKPFKFDLLISEITQLLIS